MRVLRKVVISWVACLVLLLSSAWAQPSAKSDPWAALERDIASRGVDPELVAIPGRLNDEMRVWLDSKISDNASPDETLRLLLQALIDPKGLELVYDPSYTGTAAEVWSTRKANCLGFTHLYVGLTRELGIPTYYVRWTLMQTYRKEGDLVLVSGHMSAGFGTANQMQVLEFGAVEGYEARLARPISDLNATARHYANRSAEWLRVGDLEQAMAAAEIAVKLEPSLAEAWVNLGVTRRRSGDLEGAGEAYQAATLVDPDHTPAYQNLGVLMQIQGEQDVAHQILALLDRRDNRNPFTYLSLGDLGLEEGRIFEAERYYRRALRLGRDHAETRAAMGLWALEAGELKAARKWLKKAQAIDPEEDRTQKLARGLSKYEGATE